MYDAYSFAEKNRLNQSTLEQAHSLLSKSFLLPSQQGKIRTQNMYVSLPDGNGRTARLLEKWFLAKKLGPKAWFLQSERNYYMHHQVYYQHIRVLGCEYEGLDYGKTMPFLKLLLD